MPLNPWRLRLLVQLEAHGTVRAVARHENLSPSAVSQQLGVLERETGSVLLERTGRRVRLTATGILLARRSREILAQMDEAERELRSAADAPAGTVALAVFQSAVHALAVPAVARLADRHPSIDVVVHELEPHDSMPALKAGEVDIIVTTVDFVGEPLDPGIAMVPVGEDTVVLALPSRHPLAAQESVDLAAAADQRWTFDVSGSYMSDLATRLCREAGFEPQVVCRFNNYLLALQHVEAGRSVALLPSLTLDPRYDVIARPLREPVRRRIVAAVRRPHGRHPVINAMLDELRSPLRTGASGGAKRQATGRSRAAGDGSPVGIPPTFTT